VSIGVDWKRKGIDKTIRITDYLNSKGVKTRLNIIGSLNNKIKFPKYINQMGFLNKNIKTDHLKIIKTLSNSDFHVLMTKKEACGVVFAEANSCGIFNITNDVGGVNGMIKNNINGKLFNLKDTEDKIGNYIIKIYNDKKKLFELKKKSLSYYKTKLSWKSNSIKLQSILLQAKKL
jgi:glycosyltransferase involved in cell wall biosynthesis